MGSWCTVECTTAHILPPLTLPSLLIPPPCAALQVLHDDPLVVQWSLAAARMLEVCVLGHSVEEMLEWALTPGSLPHHLQLQLSTALHPSKQVMKLALQTFPSSITTHPCELCSAQLSLAYSRPLRQAMSHLEATERLGTGSSMPEALLCALHCVQRHSNDFAAAIRSNIAVGAPPLSRPLNFFYVSLSLKFPCFPCPIRVVSCRRCLPSAPLAPSDSDIPLPTLPFLFCPS